MYGRANLDLRRARLLPAFLTARIEMTAKAYLQSRRDAHRYYRYLVHLAYLPYMPLTDSESGAAKPECALPPHLREVVQQVLDRHGASLSDEQRDAFWKHLERLEAGEGSELEWPRMIHERFLANLSSEARAISRSACCRMQDFEDRSSRFLKRITPG
jgi:hypothetical protein